VLHASMFYERFARNDFPGARFKRLVRKRPKRSFDVRPSTYFSCSVCTFEPSRENSFQPPWILPEDPRYVYVTQFPPRVELLGGLLDILRVALIIVVTDCASPKLRARLKPIT
jgi:hypothetical protein